MKIYSTATTALALLGILLTGPEASYGEYLFLKKGPVIEGKILKDSQSSITVQTREGRLRSIPRKDILRITYTRMYLGRLYVRLNNGKNFLAYKANEDSETITFRKDLNRPVEFKKKRVDIIFMARLNPGNLKGAPDIDSATLTWDSPYDKPDEYKVYSKKKGSKGFTLIDTTSRPRIKIDNLSSNTLYQFHVTAVDDDGVESPPSSPIYIKTKNSPPSVPGSLKAQKIILRNKKKMNLVLTWLSSRDSDGKVTHYIIYKDEGKGKKPVARTKALRYTIKNIDAAGNYSFMIKAVDNHGISSGYSHIVSISSEGIDSRKYRAHQNTFFNLTFLAASPVPLGKFDDIANPGAALICNASWNNLLLKNFDAGGETGILYLSGFSEELLGHFLIPLLASARYRIPVWKSFFIAPETGIGGSLNMVSSFPYKSTGGLSDTPSTDVTFEPMFYGGLSFMYTGFKSYRLILGCRYYGIIEKGGLVNFILVHVGTAIRF